MILPNKHIPSSYSLLGLGSIILINLDRPISVSSLWGKVKVLPEIGTFERFSITLALLFTIGAIDLEGDVLRRNTK